MPPPDPLGTTRVLPMLLPTGDRITDETGEWEIIAGPYSRREERACSSAEGRPAAILRSNQRPQGKVMGKVKASTEITASQNMQFTLPS